MAWAGRRRIPLFFAAATLIPIGVLAWLGLRILQQDRDLTQKRRADELKIAAGLLALDIERQLQTVETTVDETASGGGVVIRLLPTGLVSSPEASILYQPDEVLDETHAERSPSALAEAEAVEFHRRDLLGAARLYRELSSSKDPSVGAAALLGLGGVLRQTGDRAGALRAYDALEKLGAVSVAGQPAGLVARQGRSKVLEEAGDREGLSRAASDLAATLSAGGWRIDRSTFDFYRDLTGRWGASLPSESSADASARTEAAIALWRVWRRGDLESRGRLLDTEGGGALSVWTGGPTEPRAAFLTRSELEALLSPLQAAHSLAVSIATVDGRPIAGSLPPRADGVSLGPGETRLPFILTAASLSPENSGGDRARRTLLVSGLALAFLLMTAAAYGLYRTTMRAVGLARQQSDFVSAVSHEFRTPLTSMRHLTDLLVSRGVTSEERRTHYYQLLAHETERLQRMVESLLAFGRIEAGAYAWQLEPIDIAELVVTTIGEFRNEPLASGRDVHCDVEAGLPPTQADREALSRAIWNLLENAAKYSEPGRPIRVFAKRQGGSVLLGVADEGAGIRPEERVRIFQKFVRGADARHGGIRGVGIGLAVVTRIVEAHGGSVDLESEPGRGSTFTILLPVEAQG